MSNVKQLALIIAVAAGCFGDSVGIFDGHEDVGTVLHAGSVVFDPSTRNYTVTGSGENMWSTQIWRTLADGSEQEQLTSDGMNNGFPHVSPDGHRLVFLSWQGAPESPQDTEVLLRMLSIADRKINVLAKLRGGAGTLGATPWSPDGRRVVLVSYQERP